MDLSKYNIQNNPLLIKGISIAKKNKKKMYGISEDKLTNTLYTCAHWVQSILVIKVYYNLLLVFRGIEKKYLKI